MICAGFTRLPRSFYRRAFAVGTTHGEETAERREYQHDQQRELPTAGAILSGRRQWGHGIGLWCSPFRQLSVRLGAFPFRSLKLVNFPILCGSVT